jgi:hypothetical protein
MPLPSFLRRPIQISVWSNRILPDALGLAAWPVANLVLQPSDETGGTVSFVEAVADTRPWPTGHEAALGASVRNNLHPVTIEAIANIVERRTGRPPWRRPPLADETSRAMSRALADWLIETAQNKERFRFRVPQLSYIFASAAHRARAIATALRHVKHRPILHMTDIGTTVGMIPWLLQADLPEIRHFELFEPEEKFRAGLDLLWAQRDPKAGYSIMHATAEQAEFGAGADLIMCCQCVHLIAPAQRSAIMERAWCALNPGGVLLINEIVKDDTSAGPSVSDVLHRDEMIALMPGNHHVFSRKTGWRKPDDLRRVTAKALGSSSVLISVREG